MLTWDRQTGNYNELIVDGDHWTKHLPGIIEAFVFTREEPQSEQIVAEVHRRFLQAYGLSATDVPRASFTGTSSYKATAKHAREPFDLSHA